MSTVNAHGLSRDIPAGVKREVRQACGFGCVICGSALIQYEHIDPPFADAQTHDPSRMALLCPNCHDKVTRQFTPKAVVQAARANPRCKQRGFSSEVFSLGSGKPVIHFAGSVLRACPIPVQIDGVPVFKISQSPDEGGPLSLSGSFFNAAGQLSLQVLDNEWNVLSGNWDVEVAGGRITIRDALGHISLSVSFELGNGVIIDRLDMLVGGHRFQGSPTQLFISGPRLNMEFSGMLLDNVGVALNL